MSKKGISADEAKKMLISAVGLEEPVVLPKAVLKNIDASDIPPDVMIQVGQLKGGIIHIDWDGHLYQEDGRIIGEADYTWTRKYWYNAIGLEQYMDLVRRAVETRFKTNGDVKLTHYDDDGAYIQMTFSVGTDKRNCLEAFEDVQRICRELEETADAASDEASKRISEIASRLSGWGRQPLDKLVDAVENSESSDAKGRSLEELISRLLESIQGFSVIGRIRTSTEEIDITVLNNSNDPILRRESAILLVECKNWTGKCGKNEFVIFKEKVENRSNRCTVGILVSWRGHKDTITKEMLRGSKETTLIVPITGKDIRKAVRDDCFQQVLVDAWQRAVTI